ncbi:MAG: hypothetical protein EA383_03820 [Spirochaetaceae bacterium]|nr:MAG: hypothetical protein EA383_03820 [Spirochaetaceae bacterium]
MTVSSFAAVHDVLDEPVKIRFIAQVSFVIAVDLFYEGFAEIPQLTFDSPGPDSVNKVALLFSERQDLLSNLLGAVPTHVIEFKALFF